jgi:hypothetical protein
VSALPFRRIDAKASLDRGLAKEAF